MLRSLSDVRRRAAPVAPPAGDPPPPTPSREEQAVARVRAGEKRSSVCAALAVSPATLSRWCVAAGVRDPKNRGRKRVDRSGLRAQFLELTPTMTQRQIGAKFSCTGAWVSQVLSETAPA